MRVFISWSGQRSQALGNALRSWLPQVIPGISFFHSEEIPKVRNWHVEIIKALRGCSIGIFCITPESLRSQWMLFEAGALAQHGDQPTLLTYILSPLELTGPLSLFEVPGSSRRTPGVSFRHSPVWQARRTTERCSSGSTRPGTTFSQQCRKPYA